MKKRMRAYRDKRIQLEFRGAKLRSNGTVRLEQKVPLESCLESVTRMFDRKPKKTRGTGDGMVYGRLTAAFAADRVVYGVDIYIFYGGR
mmetsp:Transcript_39352/g.156258  ORF Transcript_39352/g.156258 Transcript_39352/m.156258 type:complete len:89 (-) Transcript_39352:936-1202(-)